MNGLSRSTALKIAAVLSFLLGAFGVVATLPLIFAGSVAVNGMANTPPFIVIVLGLMTGIVSVVAAYGAWKGQRWGVVLTIVANLVNGLSAVPGVLFSPGPELWMLATLTVVVSIIIIVLCLWRDRRPVAA